MKQFKLSGMLSFDLLKVSQTCHSGLRLQFYYPNVTLSVGDKVEVHFGFDTACRFVVDRRPTTRGWYVGLGFELLGFGIGGDFYRKKFNDAG